MAFKYVSTADAIAAPGLRMVVMSNVPSPWTEAAKGIFHVKRIDFSAVRLAYDDEALAGWAGQRSAPVVVLDREAPRSGWMEILMLAEKLAPQPALLPLEPHARGRVVELSNEFCGERGLGWTRRLQLVHAGLQNVGGFGERVAGYLGKKYGYRPEAADHGARVRELLGQFAETLHGQHATGSAYYVGKDLTAVDIYSAAFMALLRPLPESQCHMDPKIRAAFEWLDAETAAALDPILLEHRDRIYAEHLELPLAL
jgi:glutathione S-transferase